MGLIKPTDHFYAYVMFKAYQDHIFVFLLFIVEFSRYCPRNKQKASLFNRIFSWAISKFCLFFSAFGHLVFVSHSLFGHIINRLSYSCGLLIAFFQILRAIIGWKTFSAWLLTAIETTGPLPSDVIMAKMIGRAIAWLRKQSWPLPYRMDRGLMSG